MDFPHLLIERDGDIEVVTMDRPERQNALNPVIIDSLLRYFQRLQDFSVRAVDDETNVYVPRVVILKGAGGHFCSGLDLFGGMSNSGELFGSSNRAKNSAMNAQFRGQRRISEIVARMRRCPQPIIGVLSGSVCGGGLALALACDVRFATKDMKANVAMASIGLSGCDIGISYFLPRVVGLNLASEMMMTGRFLHAERAEKCGFCTVHEGDAKRLETLARGLAKDMLSLPSLALSLTKEGLNHSLNAPSLESQIALEDRQQVVVAQDEVFRERVQSFKKSKELAKAKKQSKI